MMNSKNPYVHPYALEATGIPSFPLSLINNTRPPPLTQQKNPKHPLPYDTPSKQRFKEKVYAPF